MNDKMRFACLVLPLLAICAAGSAQVIYSSKMTSGPFLVSSDAAAVDWAVVNNDTDPVDLRITVYRHNLLGVKVEVPGVGATIHLEPGRIVHYASSVGQFYFVGFYYEVVVEATSDLAHPAVSQWSNTSGAFLPGTLIPAGNFVLVKPKLLRFSRP